MKSVPDFIEGHQTSNDILILGQCPSSKTKPFKNGTFARLKHWMDGIGIYEWSFHNIIPNKINSTDMNDVDVDALKAATKGKKVIIALGGFVSKACAKHKVAHYKIDHPSPRNRNLNDPEYEIKMLLDLKEHITWMKLHDRDHSVL
jgi:uracil-DNA glycosylase